MKEKYIRFLVMLIVLPLFLLSGCSTMLGGIEQTTNRAPSNLRQACLPIDRLDDTKPMLLGDLIQADTDLASQYLECSKRVDGWIEWENKVIGK